MIFHSIDKRFRLKNKHSLLVVILLFCTHSIISQETYSVEKTEKLLSDLCPFQGSDKQIDKVLSDLYVACELAQLEKIDSVYQVVEDNSSYIKTALDSAFYFFDKGYYWVKKSDYSKAQKYYNKSGLLCKKLKLEVPEQYVRVHMANIEYYNKRVRPAFEEFKKVSEHDSCDTFLEGKLKHNIGVLIMELDSNYWFPEDKEIRDSAMTVITDYLDESIRMNKAIDYYRALTLTYSVYVNLKLLQEDYKGAWDLINEAESISRQTNDYSKLAFLRIKKGTVLHANGNHMAAADTAMKAVQYYRSVGNFDQENHAASLAHKAYYDAGEYTKAYETAIEMYWTYKKNYSEKLADDLSKYKEQYETEKKELKIKEQAAILEQDRLKISNRNRLLGIFGFGIISIAFLMLFLLQKSRRKAQQEKDSIIIRTKEEGLKNIINAQEEERKRIAKDLHDGIVQQLGGLKLGFQKVLANDDNPESKKLLGILDDSAQELRELSHKMMPKSLSELGLIPAITDMLDNSLGHTEIKYHFENFGLSERLKENVEITVYRISQELINNITKHSGATQVNIQLFKSVGNLILIVEDNGKGFDINVKKKGIGLMNISSRLDTVRGKVNFDPSPESGTLVTVKIPLT